MPGQSDTRTNLLPDLYRFIRIRFQIVLFFQKSMWILFTDRALPTIRRMDKILGKVSPSPYSPKITIAYRELRVLFRGSDSALHWLDLNGWDDMEFASRSSVEWRGIHQWSITCLTGVVILRTVTAAMWLKCVQHPKNAIFTQNFAMHTTPVYIIFRFSSELPECSHVCSLFANKSRKRLAHNAFH